MKILRFLFVTVLAATSLAHAQDFPTKPIHIVVPFAAGGGVDVLARAIGQRVAEQVNQPVIVDNKPGGNANIGPDFVAKSAPDGYTVLIAANGLATNPTLFPDLPFNVQRDLAPVAYVGYAPLILVAPTSFDAKTLADVIRLAKAEPGKLNYASAGSGSSQHLAVEQLKISAGIDVMHIPYKGGAPAIVDMLGGRINFMMLNPLEAIPHVKGGRLHAILVGGAQRMPLLPDVPTAAEAGLPGYEATTWWGFLMPAKTPPAIVAKLNAEINRALADPGVKKKLEEMGVVVQPGTPESFGAFIRSETDKWAAVIRKANIKAE
jgi:tripartite-type tricarboxylate transporter receptor subunit TctC